MEKDTEQLKPINFKPMTEGLGLNHFTDGLPYSPASSKKKTPPSFYNPPPRAPRVSTESKAALVGTERAKKLVEEFDVEAALEAEFNAKEPMPAGFVRRIFAYFLDIAISLGLFCGVVWAGFTLNGFDLRKIFAENRGNQIILPLVLLYMVMHVGYFLIQETTWRRTIGKAIFGTRIRASSGFATLGRSICFFIAALPLGIGLLWYFFDNRHRCWHDVISDSEVVRS